MATGEKTMSSEIVRVKAGFDFAKAHKEAKRHLAYYEEGLMEGTEDVSGLPR